MDSVIQLLVENFIKSSPIDYLYPIIAYLLGSIPFGLILSHLFGNGKLRELGSKNIGATNVMRTQGKILGVLTFFLDAMKGFIPCYFFYTNNVIIDALILIAPVIGHMFPIWLKFQGGKGVATYFGVLAALDIYVFFGTGVVWVITFVASRISSVSCLISAVFSCGFFSYRCISMHLPFFNQLCALIIVVALIFVRHRENIQRLLSKKELKF